MQVLFTLKGHIAMITTLEWSKDDVHLYSGGTHGLIFRWNLRTGQRFDLI
jgi:WD40 repeat protein